MLNLGYKNAIKIYDSSKFPVLEKIIFETHVKQENLWQYMGFDKSFFLIIMFNLT